jgi:hypothetical protein
VVEHSFDFVVDIEQPFDTMAFEHPFDRLVRSLSRWGTGSGAGVSHPSRRLTVMAAVIDLSTARRLADNPRSSRGTAAPIGRSRLATAPAILPTPQRQLPELRLIEGGRSDRAVQRRQMYRRRRLLVLTVAVLALLAGVRAVAAVGGAVASALAPEPVATQSYEVQAGDSLWSVAGRFLPGGDRRDAVARLADLNPTVVSASGGVQAGDVLQVPAS